MTDFATSPHTIHESMSTRERTARWVQNYAPQDLYSPSMPPAMIEGFVPPSPAESSHSLPPKMVLRYHDGRDVPIPYPNQGYEDPRSSRKHRSQTHARSGSHATSGAAHSPRHQGSAAHEYEPPSAPEQIRVLPSRPANTTQSSSSSSSNHVRSRSLPRNHRPLPENDGVPPVPYSAHPGGPHYAQQPAYSPWVQGSGRPSGHHSKQSPIVYAPAHHGRSRYDGTPVMLHHPPRTGPDNIIYSHSAPPVLGGGHGQYVPHQYPIAPLEDERAGRSRDREYSRSTRGRRHVRITRTGSQESLGSQASESTYYVAGQKVHVISPSPERSIGTASSATKIASPYSQTSTKKPFLNRIFGFAKFSSSASAKGSSTPHKSLRRRHSIDDTSRRMEAD